MSMRAASFATSAALLGFVVVAALSVSITLQPNNPLELGPISVLELQPDPPPPPPPTQRQTPPPERIIETAAPFDADPPPLPPAQPSQPSAWAPPVGGAAEITNPRWVRQPRDLARYYPARALARGMTGQVLLNCRVDTVGALHCVVASETPEGWGFGAAALRIAEDYRMVPATREGLAVEGRYRMRVPFEMR
ncbi:MAG: TonB family protein [Hyphomonadaceae bacterium]